MRVKKNKQNKKTLQTNSTYVTKFNNHDTSMALAGTAWYKSTNKVALSKIGRNI